MKAREATLADKAAIIELRKRCALTRPWNDPSPDFDFAHSGPASAVESDGVIVAAALVGHDGHRGSTYYVAVDPELQRNGAGRALMAAVEDWLRARGVWKLNLVVTPAQGEKQSLTCGVNLRFANGGRAQSSAWIEPRCVIALAEQRSLSLESQR
jgi:GNAT superfamily N-acetyltransferase